MSLCMTVLETATTAAQEVIPGIEPRTSLFKSKLSMLSNNNEIKKVKYRSHQVLFFFFTKSAPLNGCLEMGLVNLINLKAIHSGPGFPSYQILQGYQVKGSIMISYINYHILLHLIPKFAINWTYLVVCRIIV